MGCPLLLFVLLWRHRDLLNPSEVDETQVIAKRREAMDTVGDKVIQFALIYRPGCVLSFPKLKP